MTKEEFERRLIELLREYERSNDNGIAGCFYSPIMTTMETPWFEWDGAKFVRVDGKTTLDPQ